MSERRPRPADRKKLPVGPKPKYNAVVASATRITRGRRLRRQPTEKWQEDAWAHYDTDGTLRFAVGWIANGVSRVRLSAARRGDDGADPVILQAPSGPGGNEGSEPALSAIQRDAITLVSEVAGGVEGQAQMLTRLATLLTVPGIGWILIEPDKPTDDGTDHWKWRVLSDDELKPDGDGWQVEATDEDDTDASWRPLANDHVLVKVWRSHPRHSNLPDSNCRAALRPLRQLDKLDDHIDATADSRLAGNGLLVVPEEIKFAPLHAEELPEGDAEGDDSDEETSVVDDFMEVLTDAMVTPISNPGSAGAVVPLAVTVPGEYVDKVRHITFWSEFSDTVIQLSERAVKRLALSLDMPPEVVMGMSSMNHWGAWRVQEEAVTLHIEPLSEIICHATTIGFIRPALEAMGYSAADAADILVVGDVTDLTVRPDKSSDTRAAYENIEVSGAVLRRESGLDESDKPSEEEWRRRVLMRAVDRNPELAPMVLPMLGIELPVAPDAQLYPLRSLDGQRAEPEQQAGGTPDTDDENEPEVPDAITAAAGPADMRLSAALFEACDGIVYRALERAGSRLRGAAGKGVAGGSAVIASCDPATLHTKIDALTFANVGELLDGAFDRVPVVAQRLGVDPDALTATLHDYVRHLIASSAEHTPERLASSLAPLAAA